jgi:hypothetical protein
MTNEEREIVEDLFHDWLTLVDSSINEDDDVTRIYNNTLKLLELK